jgi:hypothetical protein
LEIDEDHPLYGEWCDEHGDEYQDHDCDLIDDEEF